MLNFGKAGELIAASRFFSASTGIGETGRSTEFNSFGLTTGNLTPAAGGGEIGFVIGLGGCLTGALLVIVKPIKLIIK